MWEKATGGSRREDAMGLAGQIDDVDPAQRMGGGAIAGGAADWAQADGFGVGTDTGDVCPAQGS